MLLCQSSSHVNNYGAWLLLHHRLLHHRLLHHWLTHHGLSHHWLSHHHRLLHHGLRGHHHGLPHHWLSHHWLSHHHARLLGLLHVDLCGASLNLLCVLLSLFLLIDDKYDTDNDYEDDGATDTATDRAALVCLGAEKHPVVVILTVDRAIHAGGVCVGVTSIDIGRERVVTVDDWAAEGSRIIIRS